MNDIQLNRNTINITVGDAMEWRSTKAIAHSSISCKTGHHQNQAIASSEVELGNKPDTAVSLSVSKSRDITLPGFDSNGIFYSAVHTGVVTPDCSGGGNPSRMESFHPAIIGGNIYDRQYKIKASTAELPGWSHLQVISATNRHRGMLVVQ